ncbi:helix-turn-helix domain-containing protein [Nanoarchaeota archaeon]
MNKKILEEIGLTKSEINVYLSLLELGSSSTGKIVDKSKVASSKIYEILDKLMQKGLASFIIKSGVKYFEAAPPERIMDYMKEKETKFNEQKQELKQILPELELKQKLAKYKSEATIYKGIKGMETAYFNALKLLKANEEVLVIGAPSRSKAMNRFFIKFNKERAKRKIKMRIIYNEAARGDERTLNNPLSEIKYTPEITPASIDIFNDRVIISPEAKEPLSIVIDSKEVAESFRVQFEKSWNQDVTISRGLEGIHGAFNKMLDELKPGEEYLVLGASWRGRVKQVPEFYLDFHSKRVKKGVKVKFLFVSGSEKLVEKYKKYYKTLSEVKFLPQGIYEGVQINLYKNKVLIFVWRDKEPIVFTIDDKKVYQLLKTYYDTLWNQDTIVTKGFKELESTLDSFIQDLNGKTYDVLGAAFGGKGLEKTYADFFEEFHKKRVKLGLPARLLFQQGTMEVIKKHRKHIFEENAELKFLPYKSENPVAIFPGKNKALLVIQEKEPITITINNKAVAKSFSKHFESIWDQETRVVKGLDAIQEIFEELLEAKSVDLIGARGYFVDAKSEYVKEWEKRAIKKGLKVRNIVDKETKGHPITKWPFAKTKYTIEKEFAKLGVFWIYGNKVIISNWTEKEPIAFIIENKHLYNMYKQQFELLWNNK